MDSDRAYLLGLIIGGGIFGNAEDVFRIRLPYKKWGSYINNPDRAGQIASDILRKVGQMFRAIYNLSVSYETTPGGNWVILCEGDTTSVKEDLTRYGIPCEGELRGAADIGILAQALTDDNLKRRFIAGLADTIGSMAKSQRRFTDERQILSFEIKGHNFKFVCELCKLLYSINCIPDQVNWNHPNIQCARDSYYRQWNKGFKLRILLDQYAKFGAFAFRTKAETQNENRRLQRETHEAEICETREIRVTTSTVHPAENDIRLPELIRGGHYIHYRHFCAVLGCEHAPYDALCPFLAHPGRYIIPFPILCKESITRIDEIIALDNLLSQRTYYTSNITVSSFLRIYNNDTNALVYGDTVSTGYPISEIMQAIAFVVANNDELFGSRPKGYIQIIERHVCEKPNCSIEVRRPDLLTPLVIVGNSRGTLIGAVNPGVYEKLISRDPNNQYKLLVRQITEEDLRNV